MRFALSWALRKCLRANSASLKTLVHSTHSNRFALCLALACASSASASSTRCPQCSFGQKLALNLGWNLSKWLRIAASSANVVLQNMHCQTSAPLANASKVGCCWLWWNLNEVYKRHKFNFRYSNPLTAAKYILCWRTSLHRTSTSNSPARTHPYADWKCAHSASIWARIFGGSTCSWSRRLVECTDGRRPRRARRCEIFKTIRVA